MAKQGVGKVGLQERLTELDLCTGIRLPVILEACISNMCHGSPNFRFSVRWDSQDSPYTVPIAKTNYNERIQSKIGE